MSIKTIINQQPFYTQPTNSEHIWNFNNPYSQTYTDYKYIVDIYIDPLESASPTRIGRLRISPNSYGNAITNIKEIVWSHIYPSPQISGNLSIWSASTESWVKSIPISIDGNKFNIGNGYEIHRYNECPDPSYFDIPRHIGEYGLSFGEEYYYGGALVQNLPAPYTYGYDGDYSVNCVSASYPGCPNQVLWNNMNDIQDAYGSYLYFEQGGGYIHTTSTGTLVTSGSSSNNADSYSATTEPSKNDILYVFSNQTGCGQKYQWNIDGGEVEGWNFIDYWCREGCGTSETTLLWPGTKNVVNTLYFDSTKGNLQNWEEVYTYALGLTKDPTLSPNGYSTNQFLTIKGKEYGGYTLSGVNISNGYEVFQHRRNHHRDCPIILNWFNGRTLPETTYGVDCVVELTGETKSVLSIRDTIINPYKFTGGTDFTEHQNLGEKILSFVRLIDDDIRFSDVESVAYYLSVQEVDKEDWDSYGLSEILKFDLYDSSCFETGQALHFVFLNSVGTWDTITFGQKNIRSYSSSKKTFKQNGIKDRTLYQQSPWEMANVPYDMTTKVIVDAQSIYVDENDVPIFRDFFLSPYVFLLTPITKKNQTPAFFPFPITITTSSVSEYKNQYNKLYQYSLSFEYNTLEDYNNSL